MKMSTHSLCAPVILGFAFLSCSQLRAGVTYLALGDSVTFGIDPSTPASLIPSYADQGFVRPFADSLAPLNGGVRPDVLNLAISGELSTSFFTGQAPPGWTTYPGLNLNYPVVAPIPQNDLMISSIKAIHAMGNSVGYVSFLIGANDVFYLVGTTAFQNATPADQRAMIAATIGTIQGNYLEVLTELKSLAPEAKIILPDYYNPFPSSAPEHAFYDSILDVFNPQVMAEATAFGATFVDLYPLFAGRELELTNIGSGDAHPNRAGYAVIADALAQAVPEPASVVVMAVGLVGLLRMGWRRFPGSRPVRVGSGPRLPVLNVGGSEEGSASVPGRPRLDSSDLAPLDGSDPMSRSPLTRASGEVIGADS
jgi:lysophospholipase L1-like esterase